jgi:hypothetical protein
VEEYDAGEIFDQWQTNGYQRECGMHMREKLALKKLIEEEKGMSKSKKVSSKRK